MGRKNRLAQLKRQREAQSSDQDIFWSDLSSRIKNGQLIPIIGNSVSTEAIFAPDDETADNDEIELAETMEDDDDSDLTVEETLAEIWADEIGYPLADRRQSARVAQYNRVKSADDYQAKTRYLNFLKEKLLALAEIDEPDLAVELRGELDQLSFAYIASELGYPHFKRPEDDPLRLLARLDLPIYATTSYFDFMERALRAENKQPRTHACFLSGQPVQIGLNHQPESQNQAPEPEFQPTLQTPLVYHLYGLEKYPESLILSEDDYLDFLTKVAHDTNQYRRLIPTYLREVLSKSSLLLLGYRLQDWDFRVLFRGVINAAPHSSSLRKISVAIQVDPRQQRGVDAMEAQRYLEKYFEPAQFKVKWGTPQTFTRQLWNEWNEWR